MKYYKLSMDMERENDIVCHYENDYGIQQNVLNIGEKFDKWDDRFAFFYAYCKAYVLDEYENNDM